MDTLDRFRQLIIRWERRLFAADDAVARRRGWKISRRPTGFGRIYRDPRWALISECASCGGAGTRAGQPCPTCAGRGTVRHDSTGAPHRGTQ